MSQDFPIIINNKKIKRNVILNLPYNSALKNRARSLRKAGNLSEVIFWKQVRAGEFHNIDFDRQRIVGNYIVDFYVKSLGLVIEIDGSQHEEPTQRLIDNDRDIATEKAKWAKELRIKTTEWKSIESKINLIKQFENETLFKLLKQNPTKKKQN